MSEVNGPKISVNQINYSGIQKQPTEVPVEQVEDNTPQLKDIFSSRPHGTFAKRGYVLSHKTNLIEKHKRI